MNKIPQHLGGHLNRTHIDEGSLTWAIETFKIESFLDIGCGPGGMVELAATKGLDAIGVDGDFSLDRFSKENFVIHDYTLSPLSLEKKYNLAWSCEFVEHVEEQYVQNFMETFKNSRYVIMTFSPPGTPGHHHVNCRDHLYWIKVFSSNGFVYDDELTKELRQKSTMKRDFVRNFGLFFKGLTI
jgi:cyclopropane fatty-acyl-phospholipid synthase-like methyltransferase